MQSWRNDVQNAINAFKLEMGDYGRCLRLSSLYDQLFDIEEEINWRYEEYEKILKNDGAYIDRAFIAKPLQQLQNKLNRLEMQIRCIVNEKAIKSKVITPEMIINARDYPVSNILNYQGRGNMKCIVHDDRTPSMGIKNNRVRCFSCQYSGDSIDVFMKLHGVNFIEAVKSLQ